MDNSQWVALLLTLKLASYTTAILLLLCLPLAWKLARWQHPAKPLVDALAALPLVLPPTVLGFYLLVAFAPDTLTGRFWYWLTDSQLAFSFAGLVLGSLIYSLPFVLQPLQNSFERVEVPLLESASLLGLTPRQRFFKIIIPANRSGIISAAALGFAHTLGEFGVVLMIGGNIPGETQVASIAIYEQVESMQYQNAHQLSVILIAFSLVLLIITYSWRSLSLKTSGKSQHA